MLYYIYQNTFPFNTLINHLHTYVRTYVCIRISVLICIHVVCWFYYVILYSYGTYTFLYTRFGGCIETDDDILTSCTEILGELKCCYPQLLVDGVHNVWIVKPGALSRGRGISCMNQLNDILELVSGPTQKKEGRWIVQKYIGVFVLI